MSFTIRAGWAVVSMVLVYLRLGGTMDNRFQAFAHLVTGGFLAVWAFGLAVNRKFGVQTRPAYYGWLGLYISLIELYAFLNGIGHLDGA